MSAKIVLIVIGTILLLLGVLLLVSAVHHDWEVKQYKKIMKKDVPAKIKTTSEIIGGILTVGGLLLIGYGVAMHTKMVKSSL